MGRTSSRLRAAAGDVNIAMVIVLPVLFVIVLLGVFRPADNSTTDTDSRRSRTLELFQNL